MNRFGKRSKKLNVGKKMPPSYHRIQGQDFDIKKSEAVAWLIDQLEILNFLWDQFKQSGDLVYDSETGIWTGVDYDD